MLGFGAGDVGAMTPPARRCRRGAQLQLLGGDAGLLRGGGQGDEDGYSIYWAALGFPGRWMDGGQTLASVPRARDAHPARKVGALAMGGAAPCPTASSRGRTVERKGKGGERRG
jgi:hypothetical protein